MCGTRSAVWKSLAHQQECMSSESYIDVALPVMESMVGQGRITQVLFDSQSDLETVLSAPVTQFVYITVKQFHDRGYAMKPITEKARKELIDIPGCLGSCWGPSVEQDKIQVGIIGWNTIQVRVLPVHFFLPYFAQLYYQDRDMAAKGAMGPTTKLMAELGSLERIYTHMTPPVQ